MPVNTSATAIYTTVQITKDKIIAKGISRLGFLHSSETVATASNPMYAKNMINAPIQIPLKPFGANGVQFSGFT